MGVSLRTPSRFAQANKTPMKWFGENRFFGTLLAIFRVCRLGGFWLLLSSKSNWTDASAHFHEMADELNRLNRLAPYPNGENLRLMKKDVEDYAKTLAGLKEESAARPMAERCLGHD